MSSSYYYGFIIGLVLIFVGWILYAFNYDIPGIILMVIGFILASVIFYIDTHKLENIKTLGGFLFFGGFPLIILGIYFLATKPKSNMVAANLSIGFIASFLGWMMGRYAFDTESEKNKVLSSESPASPASSASSASPEFLEAPPVEKLEKGGYKHYPNYEL